MSLPIIRAIDVGYGHIKYTTGRYGDSVLTDAIPSQSAISTPPSTKVKDAVMKERNTFLVPLGGKLYEVGKDVFLALDANHVTEILDNDFALSDHYTARLLGAINYMQPLPDEQIDILVLGLPLNTYNRHHAALSNRFKGEHVINNKGGKVKIGSCHVYPQPLGSYAVHLASNTSPEKVPQALCIDPGYNTVDWFVCKGMTAVSSLSGAVKRGMGAVIKAIASEMIQQYRFEEDNQELIRLIDQSLLSGEVLKLFGREYDINPFRTAGNKVVEQAAQAIRDSVGDGKAISVIILTGGGASFYEAAIRQKYPHHDIHVLPNPAHANVRGFHLLGEIIAMQPMNSM